MTSDDRRSSAPDWLASVLDSSSFARWDDGSPEAVVTGAGSVEGHPVAVVVSDFGHLGGSIGVVTADRIVAAIERATRERLPLITAPASGGTRMQDGTAAFVRMIDISTAVADHRAAGLPYLVHLRHPTTGGVLASWASLGDVTAAEPGALIGFLGPRVVEALAGERLPPDVQTAETLAAHGHVDALATPAEFRTLAARVLDVLSPAAPRPRGGEPAAGRPGAVDGWDAVLATRAPGRPGTDAVLAALDVAVPLMGTADTALVVALVRLRGRPCVVLGQRGAAGPSVGPRDVAAAREGLRRAEALGLPVVAVVDTPGGALTADAERAGLARSFAQLLAEHTAVRVPTVTVLLGQGAGGAALALMSAHRVVAAERAWLAPLPPEGASALVHRDVDHAPDIARGFGITARDLHELGVVDRVVPEDGDLVATVLGAVSEALDELGDRPGRRPRR